MKKTCWSRVVLMGALVCLLGMGEASAAVVDKETPYTGSYFMTYNNRLDSDYYRWADSGVMPVSGNGEETGTAVWDVLDVTTDGAGRTSYRLEPRNMEQWVRPPEEDAVYRVRARAAQTPPKIGDVREFVTSDMDTGISHRKDFVLKYSGEHCSIWLDKDDPHGVTDEMVAELGAEYDVKIHQRMLTSFGPFYDRDGDGKVTFIIYDIQDGYDPETGGGFVAGFFMPQDLLRDNFNCMDVLHIDSFPAMQGGDVTGVKSTMVHEFQHLIEASRQADGSVDSELPTWVNEGLSMAAEHMIYGPQTNRIDYYNDFVQPGTPLAYWNSQDALPNYSMSYLFFQYLRIQTQGYPRGGEELYRRLIEGEERTGSCVVEVVREFFPNASMADLIRNFYIALTLKEPTGLHGFGGEPAFDAIVPKLYGSTASMRLGPGAALIRQSPASGVAPGENYGGYISYAAFSPGAGGVEAPKASVPSGQIDPNRMIHLSSGEPGSTIYYTLDGTEPTADSMVYRGAPLYFRLPTGVTEKEVTVKAVTESGDGRRSEQVEYHYTVVSEGLDYIRRTVGGATTDSYDETVTGYGTVGAPDGSGLVQVGGVMSKCVGQNDFAALTPHADTEEEAYIVKYDFSGELEWIHLFGGDKNTTFYSVTAVEDGYVAAGRYLLADGETAHRGDLADVELGTGGHSGGVLVKYDLAGVRQWVLTVPGPVEQYAHYVTYFSQVAPCADGSIVAVGLVSGSELDPGDHQYSNTGVCTYSGKGMVVKVDARGELLWKTVLTEGVLMSVGELTDGCVAAVGYIDSYVLGQNEWVGNTPTTSWPSYTYAAAVRISGADGTVQKAVAYPDVGFDQGFYAMTPLAAPEGGLVAAGVSTDAGARGTAPVTPMLRSGGQDRGLVLNNFKTGMLARLGPDLTLHWMKYVDSGGNGQYGDLSWFADVAPAERGVMALWRNEINGQGGHGTPLQGSMSGLTNASYRDVAVIRCDLDGNMEWKQTIGSEAGEQGAYGVIYDIYSGVDITYLGDLKYAVSGKGSHGTTPRHGFLLTFYDGSVPYHDLAGNVGVAGAAIGGTFADAQGNYRLRLREGQTVTLEPTLSGYTFSPGSETVTMGTEDLTRDFTAAELRYTLTGRVLDKDGTPLTGIEVADGVVTDADGNYTVTVRTGTSVTLAPQAAGKSFTPARIQRPAVSGDESGLDFRVPKVRFTVSGTITHTDGRGQGGVRIGGTITEHDGTYTFTAEEGDALTLTPAFPGYHFTPGSFAVPQLTGDVTQDFTMAPGAAEEPEKPKPSEPGGTGGSGGSGGGGGSSDSSDREDDPAPAKPKEKEKGILHIAYLQGYPDGTFRPDANLTRAQCAAMLSRLTEGFDPDKSYGAEPFPDVESSRWYAVYIAFAREKGLVKGYRDGTYRPEELMTRAEFATIVHNALDLSGGEGKEFPDIAGHWAQSAIAQLCAQGILSGYPDGTFRPDEVITRGEAARILNMAYHRVLKKEDAPARSRPAFSDVTQSHWAYYEIWEASVEHQSTDFHP